MGVQAVERGRGGMRESLLAIIGNDGSLIASIEGALSVSSVGAVPIISFESFSQQVSPNETGVIILAPAQAEEAESTFRVVQEIRLCRLPLMPIVLSPTEIAGHERLIALEPFLGALLPWPEEKPRFMALMESLDRPGAGLAADRMDAATIARRLLAFTPSLEPMVNPVALAASHELPVLVSGQPGTGRTYFARVLHDCSQRRRAPFVTIDCAELSPASLERDLLGGARQTSLAAACPKNRSAVGGTVVLEDIEGLGELHQARLLHWLEGRDSESSDSTDLLPARPRILTVSSNLEGATAQGLFRRDVCDRLQGVTFHLPPLRERKADIGPLTGSMTATCCRQFSKDLMAVAPETVAALEAYPWPGNLRQLASVIQQAVLATTGSVLLPEHLPLSIRNRTGSMGNGSALLPVAPDPSLSDDSERLLILKALDRCGNNRTRAARSLGISRVTLYKKMKRHRLQAPRRWTSV